MILKWRLNTVTRNSLLILSGMGTADRLCTSGKSGVRPPFGYEPARLSSRRLALASATCAEPGEKTGTSSFRGAMAFMHVQRATGVYKITDEPLCIQI